MVSGNYSGVATGSFSARLRSLNSYDFVKSNLPKPNVYARGGGGSRGFMRPAQAKKCVFLCLGRSLPMLGRSLSARLVGRHDADLGE